MLETKSLILPPASKKHISTYVDYGLYCQHHIELQLIYQYSKVPIINRRKLYLEQLQIFVKATKREIV